MVTYLILGFFMFADKLALTVVESRTTEKDVSLLYLNIFPTVCLKLISGVKKNTPKFSTI